MCFELLDFREDAVTGAEAGDDFGDAEEERLNPPLHQFTVEVGQVMGTPNIDGGLELDPVYGASLFLRFRIPNYNAVS